MRRLVLALALPLAASLAPAPAAACGSCPRDGSVQRTLRGAFVRFHPVTFTLHVRGSSLRLGEVRSKVAQGWPTKPQKAE